MKLFALTLLSIVAISHSVQALEPAYCEPQNFMSKEVDPNNSILRDRAFKLGQVMIVGGAIGYSRTEKVIEFVENYSDATAEDKYCTWYYNDGNDDASAVFNHYYVTNPKKLTVTSGPIEYRQVLKDQFAKSKTSFLSCLEKHKILVMGCNGQMHRGPTVFGMMLSYSGCSSKNSLAIVNHLWGKNGVKSEVRQAIIEEGYKLGNEDPQARLRMQKAFTR
ncbi:MAG: hypothetical protein H7Z71_03270 [Moraxellaceae bacterium]|nr:hypothetical protein [Pseudobdellovibrionaceae bacterium]